MTGQPDPHTQVHDEKLAGMLGDRLRLMFDWYKGMVDESTGRLLYLYDPENDVTIGDGELGTWRPGGYSHGLDEKPIKPMHSRPEI